MIYRIIKTHNYYTDEKFHPNMTAEKLIQFSADSSDWIIYQGDVIAEFSSEMEAFSAFEAEKDNVLALNFAGGRMNWDELTLEMESDDACRIIAEFVKVNDSL
jgi:hypothetical protein